MNIIIPEKLKKGDEIRVIAPARSLSLISKEIKKEAVSRLEEQGYLVTFSKNCEEDDIFGSSSVESRINDIHDAFRDKSVKAIFTVVGGFNSNQLLKYLDYDLIRNNPKIICGYSDITALNNAIFKKTGLVSYIGPHFSTWGMKKGFDYTLEYFNKCLAIQGPYKVEESLNWSDDTWFLDQENRNFIKNDGAVIINEGFAEGVSIGGNLCTLNLLQGTEFMPDISDSVLFIEDDDQAGDLFSVEFDRNLQSLIDQPNFNKVRGIIIGRFQRKTDINIDKLKYIISTKKELNNIPVVSYMNFGHTSPLITLPIGGQIKINAKNNKVSFEIITH